MASNVDNVKVEISVVLGQSIIPMHKLLRMGRGAVIELDTHQDDPVTIMANDKPVAKGEIQIQATRSRYRWSNCCVAIRNTLNSPYLFLFSTPFLHFSAAGHTCLA